MALPLIGIVRAAAVGLKSGLGRQAGAALRSPRGQTALRGAALVVSWWRPRKHSALGVGEVCLRGHWIKT
jgi:hypothetical protein